ncbi:MAG: glcF [Rhodospirillales bacterium]|nr:glcF [Rhodospirillales bacterium]
MQTSFTLAQLADPDTREAEKILRTCVHCGFCTATCPTYVLLGDELDSPRGRIYLLKDMLENARPATAEVVKHIDRCLSCLGCMTTCPSGVNYMHLVDHGRRRIEETYVRPLADRLLRRLLGWLLPRPGMFRLALVGAWFAKPLARFMPAQLAALLSLAPRVLARPSTVDRPQVFAAAGRRVKRVALLTGCVQNVIAPAINEATVRLLTRHGCEIVVAAGAGCCGALTHHLGRDAGDYVRANIDAWSKTIDEGGLDAIVVNASGCGTHLKDYGFQLREDPAYAERAARISALAKDVTEVLAELDLPPAATPSGLRVAYHSACSMQHGQRIHSLPKKLLQQAGFTVLDVPEAHLCCGSAGTYNIMQPELATALRDRKLGNIASIAPQLIATGNIGCMTQLGAGTRLPLVHTVELLDWATGGPVPPALAGRVDARLST